MFTKGYCPYNKGKSSWNKGKTYKCAVKLTCKRGHENTEGSRYSTGGCKKCIREVQLSKFYGISPKQYNDLLIKQKYACAVCGDVTSATLHIDHDHGTKRVRGLLCTRCNPLLGYAKDDVSILMKAINYLKTQDQESQ